MNDIDPAKRFPPEAARELQASPAGERPSVLNEMARQVASQLGNDTVTPVMVSGTLRILEFAALTLSGLVVYWFLVGPFDLSEWQYYIVIAAGSAIAVAFLEFSDCYQVAALMRPFATFSRILLIWAGTFALMALTAFMLKVGADFSRLMFGVWFVTGFVLQRHIAPDCGAADPPLGAQRAHGAPRGHRRGRQGRRGPYTRNRAAAL